MSALPAYLVELLGPGPLLEAICPRQEARGARVDRIRKLTQADLADSQKVVSAPHLELVRGGLLYAVDALGPAHAIFQEDHTALGSYWHGMMHRREGDFSNACYWFRQAGAIPALRDLPDFDPVSFTMSCARAKGESPEAVALQVQEWEVLLLSCLQKALGPAPR